MPGINRRALITRFAAAAGATGIPLAQAASPRSVVEPQGSAPESPRGRAGWVRNVQGKILYIGDDGRERGREWFGFSHREDRQVTLRAYCEIDDTRVERDVVQSMTERFEPLDCFVRLHVRGKFLGTGWIRVSDTEAECELFSTAL